MTEFKHTIRKVNSPTRSHVSFLFVIPGNLLTCRPGITLIEKRTHRIVLPFDGCSTRNHRLSIVCVPVMCIRNACQVNMCMVWLSLPSLPPSPTFATRDASFPWDRSLSPTIRVIHWVHVCVHVCQCACVSWRACVH